MPRVLDGRAGVYNRVGLLGGLGAPVNNCQQFRKQPSWGARVVVCFPDALNGPPIPWVPPHVLLSPIPLLSELESLWKREGPGGFDYVHPRF